MNILTFGNLTLAHYNIASDIIKTDIL